jgi:MinD-like ATPase involved in chromosome partitioning or flagellar assembly
VPTAGKRYREAIQANDRTYNLDRIIREAPLGRCVVIAVVSPKGGAGKTTISALLGMLFAELRRDPVLALDANPDFVNLKDKLGRPADPAIATDELAAWLAGEASVRPAELAARLGVGPHGVRFLPSPVGDLERMVRAADFDLYRNLLARLRDYEGIILVDCGTGLLDPPVRAALGTADQIVLVTDSAADTAALVVTAAHHLPRTSTWLVANKMPSKGATVDLGRVQVAIPQLRGVTVIPEQRLTENIVTPQFSWDDAPDAWQEPIREIAARLANSWKALR